MNWNSGQIKEDAERRKKDLHLRLAQIPEEKQKLDDEVQSIKRELIGLDQVLDGLEVMTSGPVPTPDPAGFTDKIRKLLSDTSVPLVPTQIRDALEQAGVTATSSKNLLISVHTVLDRIDAELEKIQREDGKIAYKRKMPWTFPSYADELGVWITGAGQGSGKLVMLRNMFDDKHTTTHPAMKLTDRLPKK